MLQGSCLKHSEIKPALGLQIDLKVVGAEILVGMWVLALNISETGLRRVKFDESHMLPDGSLMKITKIYSLDAVYDTLEDIPEDVKANKRYVGSSNWVVQKVT